VRPCSVKGDVSTADAGKGGGSPSRVTVWTSSQILNLYGKTISLYVHGIQAVTGSRHTLAGGGKGTFTRNS